MGNVTDFIKKPVRKKKLKRNLLHAINIINRRVKMDLSKYYKWTDKV